MACDTTGPIRLGRQFDLVVSLEVAEHRPAEAAGRFVADLVALGKVVCFSAAGPGQGGTNDVNEQWPDYWKRLFDRHGYVLVDCLRRRFRDDPAAPGCYKQNMVLYVEAGHLAASPALRAERDRPAPPPLAVVHPEVLRSVLPAPTLRPLLRALPAVVRAGRNLPAHLRGRAGRVRRAAPG